MFNRPRSRYAERTGEAKTFNNAFNTSGQALQFSEVATGDHYISAELNYAESGVDIHIVSRSDNSWVGFRDGLFKAQFITATHGSQFISVDGFDFIGNNFFSVSIRNGYLIVSDGVTTKDRADVVIGVEANYTQIGGRSTGSSDVTLGEVVIYDLDNSANSSVFSSDGTSVSDLVGVRTVSQQPTIFRKALCNYDVDPSPFLTDMAAIKTKYQSDVTTNPITSVTSGNIGEIFAFNVSGWLYVYLEAYKKTGDTFWLDLARTGCDHMLNYTDKARFDRAEITCSTVGGDPYIDAPKTYLNNDGTPGFGWRRDFGGGWSLSVLVGGVVGSAIAKVADYILDNADLSAHHAQATGWLTSLKPIFDEHDTSWSETKNSVIDGSWFFVNPTNPNTDDSGLYSNPLGNNHSLKMLSVAAIYHKHIGDDATYPGRISKFMDFFRRHLFEVDGIKVWWYAYDVSLNTKTEDINHGSYDIHSLSIFTETGHIEESEMIQYTTAIYRFPFYGRSGLLFYRIDGIDGGLPEDTISTSADNLYIALEWYYAQPYTRYIAENAKRTVSVLLSQANTTSTNWALYFAAQSVL